MLGKANVKLGGKKFHSQYNSLHQKISNNSNNNCFNKTFSFSLVQTTHFLPIFQNTTRKRFYSTENKEQDVTKLVHSGVSESQLNVETESFSNGENVNFDQVLNKVVDNGITQEVINEPSWYQMPLVACQSFLEGIHSLGLPWWSSIIVASVCFRAVAFPLQIKTLKSGLDTQRGTKFIVQIKRDVIDKMGKGAFETRQEAAIYEQQQILLMYKRENINPFRAIGYSLVQAPIYMVLFFTLRRMANTIPEFAIDGTLWFTSLATPDPYYILPLILSGSFIANMEIIQYFSKKLQEKPLSGIQIFLKNLFRILGVLLFPFMCYQPSSVLLYWASNNVLTMLITLSWRLSFMRNIFGFPKTIGLSVQNEEMPDTKNCLFVPRSEFLRYEITPVSVDEVLHIGDSKSQIENEVKDGEESKEQKSNDNEVEKSDEKKV